MSEPETTVTTGIGPILDPSWDALVASAGTIFHSSRFLAAWWRDTENRSESSESSVVSVSRDRDRVGACAFETTHGLLRFAGGTDVVDYMGPVAAQGHEDEVARAIVDAIYEVLPWNRAWLGGLDAEASVVRRLVELIRERDSSARVETYDHVPRIDSAPDGYLASLTSKRRAEVLRKRNRLAEAFGETTVTLSGTDGDWAEPLDRLLEWKAVVSTETRSFIDDYGDFVRDMIGALAPSGDAQLAELLTDGQPLAAAVLLAHNGTRYLYNMSYDTKLVSDFPKPVSPGVVLVSHLAERTLQSQLRFDFLKGAQDYKLRLGGVPDELFAIELNR